VSFWVSLLLPRAVRKALLNVVMRPFEDPSAALHTDVWLLRSAPLMPAAIPIHGLVYDVATGWLHHVVSSPAL
jgi:carbonic anhydrase